MYLLCDLTLKMTIQGVPKKKRNPSFVRNNFRNTIYNRTVLACFKACSFLFRTSYYPRPQW